MDEEEINYRFLRKIQQIEKNSPKLSEITSEFYKDILNHLESLEERLKDEKNTQKQKILNEEIIDLKKIVLNIYEQREKKILLAAISKARGGKPNIENMLEIEKKIFNSILENIKEYRSEILSRNQKKKEEDEEKEQKDNNKKEINKKPIVRATEDIPEFIGTDKKKYNLKKNDILSISPDMCKMITKGKVCEKIEM